ncbi:hypothetical protein QLH32_12125 [Acinetobacter corruptisaponis]|uniref:Uncharacterized protein n=1 Tax=Acinetobacter corruptisaponis TaxID=3045147 RepID=A0ABY8S0E8_9GAMM|nr:hypothetical protein [Acinetobacter sp. KCTC 92772]WHP04796.1 hypothetical protein QLH32_12125 [Acinetobacter sp. KCTC 92772]
MGLLDFINTDESYEYISLKEAIIFLKEKTNSTIQEVAIYLLNKGVPSDLACHTKGSDYKIKETSGKHFSYGMFRPYGRNWAFEYLTNISESYNCATWAELKNYNPLWEDWGIPLNNDNVALLEKTYWYRQAFLNLEPIKSLNLFDENLPELNPDLIPIWDENYLNILNADNPDSKETGFDTFVDDNFLYTTYDESNKPKKLPLYFKNNTFTPNQVDGLNDNLSTQETIGCGQPSIQQVEPSIENLNCEIVRLRNLLADQTTEIQDLKSKIQELETPPTIQNDKPDLLALILDETQTDRYAPDLVYSIKLWLDVYVNNPKADSHNNKANTWIKNNTPYNGEQDDTPTRRIREIATPFRDLHQSRKRLLENK